jgi:DNA-binding NarL/FixJ family response regulator
VTRVFKTVIVEDNRGFREALRDALQSRFPFCELSAVGDFERALAAARSQPPDLMVVDLVLLERSGLELIRNIRALGLRCTIAALTIHDLPEYRDEAIRSGADHFFAKLSTSLTDIFDYVEGILAVRYRALVHSPDFRLRSSISSVASRYSPPVVYAAAAGWEEVLAAGRTLKPHSVFFHSHNGADEEKPICDLLRREFSATHPILICVREGGLGAARFSPADVCLSFGESLESDLGVLLASLLAGHAEARRAH